MTTFTVRDREIIVACYAMRVFMQAIVAVSTEWRQEDVEIAENLLRKLERAKAEVITKEVERRAKGQD